MLDNLLATRLSSSVSAIRESTQLCTLRISFL